MGGGRAIVLRPIRKVPIRTKKRYDGGDQNVAYLALRNVRTTQRKTFVFAPKIPY